MPGRDSKLVRTLLTVFFAVLVCYGLYEGWGMLYGPVIEIPNSELTVHDPKILVSGRADRITELRINGAVVSVTEQGVFEEPFLLAPGSNRFILEASDARGRTTRETLDILYVPRESPTPPAPLPTSTPTSTSAR